MTPPRLVALRALGLGDFLTAVPALRALAAAFPDHHRILATTAGVAPLVKLFEGIDEVVEVAPLGQLPKALHHPDVAVNLHGSGPQSHRLLQALAPGRLIAFANGEAAVDGPQWSDDEHEVSRWCRLLTESGIPAEPAFTDVNAPPLAPPPVAVGATVLHPGAAFPARRWFPERWVEVARHEQAKGHTVVLTGGPDEVTLCSDIASGAGLPKENVLAGDGSVLELAAVIAAARRVVCGDTGVAHLATALARPSVVLFGPVSPAYWGPPKRDGRHRAIWAGRVGDPHSDIMDSGLALISVRQVVEALDQLPEHAPANAIAATSGN